MLGYSFLAAISSNLLPFLAAPLLASVVLAVAAAVVNSRYQPLPPSLRRIWQSIRLDWTRLSFLHLRHYAPADHHCL